MVCVAVIALLLVHTLGDNEISGPGGNAGSALLASGGNAFAAAGVGWGILVPEWFARLKEA
mgnify:CR=1 FL=1